MSDIDTMRDLTADEIDNVAGTRHPRRSLTLSRRSDQQQLIFASSPPRAVKKAARFFMTIVTEKFTGVD
jgi:hypothetical protein